MQSLTANESTNRRASVRARTTRAAARCCGEWLGILVACVGGAGCSGAGPEGAWAVPNAQTDPTSANANEGTNPSAVAALAAPEAAATTTEDGLAQAFSIFKSLFTSPQNGQAPQSQIAFMGVGYHPGLSTEKVLVNGVPISGTVDIDFPNGFVSGLLTAPQDQAFDLYFVKNAPGKGTVAAESFDRLFKIGTFAPDPNAADLQTLSVAVGTAPFPQNGVNFDLDMAVVTRAGKSPTASVIATGARTLFEKRFFRQQAGATRPPVTGTLANFVDSNDPLVQRGAQLFVNEGFNGNGRKCATCHPLANNQTIDPNFVASLPPTDVSAGRFLRTPASAEAWIDVAEGYWKQFVWSPFK
jgi:hypothetical protein